MKRIGKFEVQEIVGRGAMGVVYKARDPYLDRVVAVKVMTAHLELDPEIRTRFFREAQAAGSLQHPNITTVFELGESDGHPYIAMEFVPGRDLDDIVGAREPLTVVEKVDIIEQICRGLSYAHDRGVIHRDVKPANIRITEMGQAKIMDFGVARLMSSELTSTGALIGTPYYMAPELIEGRPVDARADVFSVGATFYELLSYTRPFYGDSLQAVFHKILHARPAPLRDLGMDVPPLLQEILDRTLAKDPSERYESMGELLTHLMRFWETVPSASQARASATSSIGATASRPRRRRRRRARVAIVGAAVALAALGGVSMFLRTLGPEPPGTPAGSGMARESLAGTPPGARAAGSEGTAEEGADADATEGARIRSAEPPEGPGEAEAETRIRQPAGGEGADARADAERSEYDASLARAEAARDAAMRMGAPRLSADAFGVGESLRAEAALESERGRYAEARRRIELARIRYEDARQQAAASWRSRVDSAKLAVEDARSAADRRSEEYVRGRSAESEAQAAERMGDYADALANLAIAADAYGRAAVDAGGEAAQEEPEEAPAEAGEMEAEPPAEPEGEDVSAEAIIRSTLDELRRAIESEDLAALRRVWTGLSGEQLRDFQDAFRAMRDIRVTFDVRGTEMRGDRVIVRVQTTYDFFNETSREADHQTFEQELELGQRDGRWVVVASRG